LGISPLYVRRDDQITVLTHLLMLALRVLTLIETQVRLKLRMTGEQLSGLYEGQPSIQTARPTGVRLLKAFAHCETTLTRVELGDQCFGILHLCRVYKSRYCRTLDFQRHFIYA
jgi:transposase